VPRSIARSLEKMPKRASNISELLLPAQKKGLSREKITDLAFSGKVRKKLKKNADHPGANGCNPKPFFLL
jgi:hypothetical protein